MPLLNFNHKPKNELEEGGRKTAGVTPEQLEKEPTRTCPSCRKEIPVSGIRGNFQCCPKCGHHFRMSARQRIRFIHLLIPAGVLIHLLQSPDLHTVFCHEFPVKRRVLRFFDIHIKCGSCKLHRFLSPSLPGPDFFTLFFPPALLFSCRLIRQLIIFLPPFIQSSLFFRHILCKAGLIKFFIQIFCTL